VKRGYVARATGDSHQAKNRRDDVIAGTPTSGGVAQGHNIKAGSSRSWQSWTTQHALADAEGKIGFRPKQIAASLPGDSIPGEGITRRFNRSRPMKVVIITETVSGARECQVADIRICRARQFCDER
jgi:hypothetical protein